MIALKKEQFRYPLANMRKRVLFGESGRDDHVGPGVIINGSSRRDIHVREGCMEPLISK